MTEHRATVKTVAERAGVSIASVSRVLNGLATRPETIERVNRAVAELNYVPAASARSLKLGSTGQIACAFSDVGNPVYVDMIESIERVVSEAGLRLVIHSTKADPDVEAGIVRGLANGYADGLIMSPLRPRPALTTLLAQCREPVVVIGRVAARAGVDRVRVDSAAAARMAMEHLQQQGCERIALINGPADTTPGRARLAGFVAMTKSYGPSLAQALMASGDAFDYDTGRIAARDLLKRVKFDGLFCATDTLAFGAMRTLQEFGVRVPDEVKVASIDNTPLARLMTPQLTSVDLLAKQRGEMAAKTLLERLADPDRSPQLSLIDPELVVRESTSELLEPSVPSLVEGAR